MTGSPRRTTIGDDTDENRNLVCRRRPATYNDDDRDDATADDDLDGDGCLGRRLRRHGREPEPGLPETLYNGIDDTDDATADDDLDGDGFALADDCDDTEPGTGTLDRRRRLLQRHRR